MPKYKGAREHVSMVGGAYYAIYMSYATMNRDSARKRQRKFCPHCNQYLSKSAFYDHKRDYFDPKKGTWTHDLSTESGSDLEWESVQKRKIERAKVHRCMIA